MKYLIFDIDGTLSNTTAVDDKCYIEAFRIVFGEDISDVNWTDIINLTDWGIAEELVASKLNRTISDLELQQLKETHIDLLKNELNRDKSQFNEILGAKSFFGQVTNLEDIAVGIATGAWEESAMLKLNAIGIDPNTVCFSNSNYHKSREAITTDVISQLKFKTKNVPKEIVYFGDGIWDYKTCQNLDIEFIGIDYRQDHKLEKAGAKQIFKDFSAADSILKHCCI